jgi:hypothetical protein
MKISCLGYDTIDWKFITGVLEEHDASFLRVVQEEIGNKLPVNTMFQKTAVFINNAVKTSHHTNYMFSRLSLDFCSLMTRTDGPQNVAIQRPDLAANPGIFYSETIFTCSILCCWLCCSCHERLG